MTYELYFATFNNIQQARCNNQITAPELRVIDEGGENLGVMATTDALKLAHDRGLDLIEISANAKPPVARIMSFDKYRYQEEKKYKKEHAAQKVGGIKQVQIGVKTAANDLQIKSKKANEFLNEGYKVTVMLTLRGREKAHQDFARERLKHFLTLLEPHKIEMSARFVGRGIATQITK